jgi:hypothetical protein
MKVLMISCNDTSAIKASIPNINVDSPGHYMISTCIQCVGETSFAQGW